MTSAHGAVEDDKSFRILVERSPYCIHEINTSGRLTSMNPAGLCMMGAADEAEVVGIDYRSIPAPEDRERITGLLERTREGESREFEFQAGNGRSFRSLFEPIFDEEGNVLRLMGITQDVTERHVLEAQLRQAQKLEVIGQLAGGIAHDFNNLQQVILGNLEIVMRALEADDSITESLEAIRHASKSAEQLTRQLLAVGRRQPMQFEPVCLNEVLEGLLGMLRRVLATSISVDVRRGSDLPKTWADPAQLEQVLLNLCLNSSQAMPDGGVLRLETGGGPDPERVWIRVSDTGIGMDDEAKMRAFEPFYTTKPRGEGSGLGLSMVHAIVTQHRGQVRLDASRGKGTRVTVELPVYREPA
jgi:two-component system cell cycle sensor histidine kinase/response regulator CckA